MRALRWRWTGLLLLPLLVSCSSAQRDALEAFRGSPLERQARAVLEERLGPYASEIGQARRQVESMRPLFEALGRVVEAVWGEDDAEVASERRYVKYGNDYQARVIVDCEQGWLRVETVAEEAPLDKLETAIVMALLTPRNLGLEDIFSDAEPDYGEEPFLYRQVLDHDDEPVRYQWRAERFARHLLATAVERDSYRGRTRHAVQVGLVANHLNLRQLQFADAVLGASRRYGIDPALIYAVIEVESAFNPFAISPASAYGLMQVVPATAGRDVFERVRGEPGEPTRDQLFDPDFNIDVGTAYLYLLDRQYLARIDDRVSRGHAKIAAYNGGPGSTLRAFHSDQGRALSRINGMTPAQVYRHLVSAHPFGETRRYLEKVRAVEPRYR